MKNASMHKVLQLARGDNVLIALTDLKRGETIEHEGGQFTLLCEIPAKHKFPTEDFGADISVRMYGVQPGKTSRPVRRGELLRIADLCHQTQPYQEKSAEYQWREPRAEGRADSGIHSGCQWGNPHQAELNSQQDFILWKPGVSL
jgi:altronate hydrolase